MVCTELCSLLSELHEAGGQWMGIPAFQYLRLFLVYLPHYNFLSGI